MTASNTGQMYENFLKANQLQETDSVPAKRILAGFVSSHQNEVLIRSVSFQLKGLRVSSRMIICVGFSRIGPIKGILDGFVTLLVHFKMGSQSDQSLSSYVY